MGWRVPDCASERCLSTDGAEREPILRCRPIARQQTRRREGLLTRVAELPPETPEERRGMRSGGQSDQPSYRESADQSQFHWETPHAQVARMQMLPAGMPGRYNFRVIITKYICWGTGNAASHRL